jgi:hypothetical protein
MGTNNLGISEDWLNENGTIVPTPLFFGDFSKGTNLICLVENRNVKISALVYDPTEWDIFADNNDSRPKVWYEVPTEKLLESIPEHKYRLTEVSST